MRNGSVVRKWKECCIIISKGSDELLDDDCRCHQVSLMDRLLLSQVRSQYKGYTQEQDLSTQCVTTLLVS